MLCNRLTCVLDKSRIFLDNKVLFLGNIYVALSLERGMLEDDYEEEVDDDDINDDDRCAVSCLFIALSLTYTQQLLH